jgi:lysyl-tRNA synthetase class 2
MKDKHINLWKNQFTDQMNVRLEKRDRLESTSGAYKNNIKPDTKFIELIERYSDQPKESIKSKDYKVAGRVLMKRNFGKAAFLMCDDGSSRFQLYIKKDVVSNQGFEEFQSLDNGDIVYAEGKVFKTMKGDLALEASDFQIVTKAIRPLPEKFQGLTDTELRYRMRYVDMIMNEDVRNTLKKRSQIIRHIRNFFDDKGFFEVETPMLHSVAGGASAKPFETYHNSLNLEMNLRIAPELHLKRLIVGGYDKVFEMNRCFRNEGLSLKHNPEFTSLEFYWSYATYLDLIPFTEELIGSIAKNILNSETVMFGENEIKLTGPYKKMTMREAVAFHTGSSIESVNDKEHLLILLNETKLDPNKTKDASWGKLLVHCFEELVESKLIQPTFITEYPTEVSPLSRRNNDNPEFVDRFEFFMNGWELANAFSELNNSTDQLERFAEQSSLKESGKDEEACDVDYDFIRALEYGMPPTAGQGIGIDRLIMVLTNSPSIRDVICFPQLKKEQIVDE